PPLPVAAGPGYATGVQASPGMSRGTKWLVGCLAGGCALTLVVLIGAFLIGGLAFSRNFSLQGGARVPSDFPVYPGAKQQAGFTVKSKDGNPGRAISLVQWQVAARGGPVNTWYRDQLNRGDWEILRTDDALGRLTFRRRSTGAVDTLQIRDQLAQTLVQLLVSGDQPLERGAHPAPTDVPASGP
ncbi:MAG TPA: hypothetical protein VIN56_11960, partial [Candidatus Dormibacteraeota bacterium]